MFHVVLYQPEIPPNTGTHLHLIEPLGFRLEDKECGAPDWIIEAACINLKISGGYSCRGFDRSLLAASIIRISI